MDFTFLKEDQIWGDDALDVIKKYGTAVAPTDLAAILGGDMQYADGTKTSEGEATCFSWTASSCDHGHVRCVSSKGGRSWVHSDARNLAARPALPPSEASKISPSKARVIDGIRVAEYGEYPQTVADKHTSEKLERLHGSRSLHTTGKNYTFDTITIYGFLSGYDKSFEPKSYPEYEMDGKRYIRVLGRPFDDHNKLSTGKGVKQGKPYWVEVQPIEWLMDPSGWVVAKKCLFAGIKFSTYWQRDDRGNDNARYYGNFYDTFMHYYLKFYFAKEMEPTERVAARTESRDYEEEGTRTASRDYEEEGIRATIQIRFLRNSR